MNNLVDRFLPVLASRFICDATAGHIRIFIIYEMFPRWAKKTADTVLPTNYIPTTSCGVGLTAADKYNRFDGTAWDPPVPATVKPAILIVITLVCIQAISKLSWIEQRR